MKKHKNVNLTIELHYNINIKESSILINHTRDIQNNKEKEKRDKKYIIEVHIYSSFKDRSTYMLLKDAINV